MAGVGVVGPPAGNGGCSERTCDGRSAAQQGGGPGPERLRQYPEMTSGERGRPHFCLHQLVMTSDQPKCVWVHVGRVRVAWPQGMAAVVVSSEGERLAVLERAVDVERVLRGDRLARLEQRGDNVRIYIADDDGFLALRARLSIYDYQPEKYVRRVGDGDLIGGRRYYEHQPSRRMPRGVATLANDARTGRDGRKSERERAEARNAHSRPPAHPCRQAGGLRRLTMNLKPLFSSLRFNRAAGARIAKGAAKRGRGTALR